MLQTLRRTGRRRFARALAVGCLVCAAATAVAAEPSVAAESECDPWPGEPSPLPHIDDPQPHAARWAELRAEELTVRAQLAEADDPVESQRLWRRVLCLDPKSAPAWNGVGRTAPVRAYQPDMRWSGRARANPRDPWGELAAIARVPVPPPPISPETRERLAAAEAQIAASEASLGDAHFQQALDAARAADGTLGESGSQLAAGRRLRARAAVAAGTAQIALGQESAARASFDRALAAEPRLQLDAATTSPKVIEAFEAARAGRGGAQ